MSRTVVARALCLVIASVASGFASEPRDPTITLPVVDKHDIHFVPLSANGEVLNKWVKGIAQDNQGFIWFATNGGLFRYDGYAITPFPHDSNNPKSVGSDNLSTIYKDRSGILWIGTADAGLDRFDPAHDVFTHYRHRQGVDSSLINDAVPSVFQDRSGMLWIATHEGLDRLDPSNGTFRHYRHSPQDPTSLSTDAITILYEDSYANVWVGTNQGLCKLDRETGRSVCYRPDPANPDSLGSDFIGSIVEDSAGTIWVGSPVGGVLNALDVKTGEFTRYSFYSEKPGRESNSGVTSILADPDGSLWLTTVDSGLLKLDPQRTQFSRYLSGQTTRLFEDAEGVIWIGTRTQGVLRFPRKSPAFVNYENKTTPPQNRRENEIQSVGTDSEGNLWIGMTNGVQMLDPASGRITRYDHDAKNPSSISNAPVFAISEDHSGRMWFGTYGAGLDAFDRRTGRFVAYRHDPKNPAGLSGDRILCLLVDQEGMLWVGTEEGGLDRFDPSTGKFKVYKHNPSDPHSLPSNGVTALFEDRAGALWLGGGASLERLDPKSEQFTAYDYDQHPATIHSIHEDRHGALWIGTEGGLDRLDLSGRDPLGALKKFTTKDGLPDLYVKGILEDRHGDLWLATHNGLSHFSQQTGQFHNYFISDGLPSNTFDLLGDDAHETPAGEMVVGASNGVTVFDPDRISPNSYVPPVVLTDFLLFNKRMDIGGKSPLQRPIWATNTLTLNHDQSIFTLSFAALSYVDPERNRYRYRLEGLEDWNEVDSTRRLATYTNLSPGHYIFRVQGSNNDQVWNNAGINLAITVLPPWYATWWFTALLGISAAGIIVMAHRLRVRSLKITASRLELQVAERTLELKGAKESAEVAKNAAEVAKDAAEHANRAKSAFLSHMSHELRTPLNAILGFARLLREDGVSEHQRRADLDIISRSGEHLLGLINEVLDMAKIEAGRMTAEIAPCDLGRLVQDVIDMMRVRASEKSLELRLLQPPEFPRFVETDANKLREMLINLVGNGIKYTERGSITLRLNSRPDSDSESVRLCFEVQDTGIGIAAKDQERIFEPFFQLGHEQRQNGTGLGLAITRQFAILLGGSIRVNSAPGEGSLFRLEIPAKRTEPVVSDSALEGEYFLAEGQSEYRVLVVDDDPANRILLERLLVNAGFHVRVADDGAPAIEIFQSWRPHFIWMDLRMPGADGAEATHRIRGLEGGTEVKISAVTASEYTQSAKGMDDLIHKPYRAKEIFDCMARHLGVRYLTKHDVPAVPVELPQTLRPEAMAGLPNDLRTELTNAVLALNVKGINAAIKRVAEVDPTLAATLAFHAERFAFTKVLHALMDSENIML